MPAQHGPVPWFSPHDTMQPLPTPPLCILPGRLIVTFLVNLGCVGAALVMAPSQFLEGLRAARDLLGFAELWRDDEALEELLPWAGNV